MKELQAWVDQHFEEIKKDFYTFLRFKTISADPESKDECASCAKWLGAVCKKLGLHTEIIETAGQPLVYAEDLSAGPRARTLLIYGHYDVQPVDPIELWKSDPFEPVEKHGSVFARGALDDKGQIFYALMGLRALRELSRPLPVNLKFCIEGEEEFGSKGLLKMLPSLKKKLSADDLLVVDFDILEENSPSINLGARGILTMDVLLSGSSTDLHSGLFGGVAYNPNRALAELLTECWDENGRVQVPHFYDDVVELSKEEKELFSHGYSEKFIADAGIKAHGGEKGKTLQEANWFQPTFEINGMAGGYAGPGFKTVIPAEAKAKISCRLVPNQDPEKIGRHVSDFLHKKIKKGIKIEVKVSEAGTRAYRGSPDSKLAQAAVSTYEEIFHKKCVRMVSGGSIPVGYDLIQATNASIVGIGYGLPSDNIHAPNEHFGLDRFKKGILTVASLLGRLGT
jgi:acetylornithine deacetylase/succinyl-diaminopimelate desuccinylase-like protein